MGNQYITQGLDHKVRSRVRREIDDALREEAAARGVTVSDVLREILGDWYAARAAGKADGA